jgi:hypothetical protein
MKIVFSTTNHLLSRAIRWLTSSQVSHCSIHAEMAGVPVVIEATIGGVRIIPLSKWATGNTVVGSFEPRLDMISGLAHAVEHVGDRYDYVGLLGYIPVLLARWLRLRCRNPLASPSAMVCAELILHLDHGGNVPEWRGLDPEATTPQDLLSAMTAGGSFRALR